jgi:chromosomal replication initiation ATPase DnaA
MQTQIRPSSYYFLAPHRWVKNDYTIEKVIGIVGLQLGLTPAEILSHRQSHDVALARQVVGYICNRLLKYNCVNVGAGIGRDRTTVIAGNRNIENLLFVKDKEAMKVIEILNIFKNV